MRNTLTRNRFQCNQPLSRRDLTPDHPIQRSAVEQLIRSLWRHPGDVHDGATAAVFAALCGALLLPARKVGNRIGSHAKLDQMQNDGEFELTELRDAAPRAAPIALLAVLIEKKAPCYGSREAM